HLLGASGGAEKLHYLLEYPHTSRAFRHDQAELLPYGGRNPLYAVIHESSYADGVVTDWSAARMLPDDFREDPTLLTGEHI
ncbi:aminopeptidase, partial [Salmonella enterica subsp. enterica serovar Enteritidis]|nr:aminopeptidase [Salmonella enterica subsp. enterica serovar Enteritidis]